MSLPEKIAKRVLTSENDVPLESLLQSQSSKAKIALGRLQQIVSKSMELINDSDHREHIYEEAGDMIFNTSSLMEELNSCIDVLSYASSKMELKRTKPNVPAALKDEIDLTVKKSDSQIERVAKRWASSQLPGQVERGSLPGDSAGHFWNPTFTDDDPENEGDFKDESIHKIDNADDWAKSQSRRWDTTDWGNNSFTFVNPSVSDKVRR